MPIEFRCTQCAKLLRTPDDTAGQQAKCPACQAIVAVPAKSSSAAGPEMHSVPVDSGNPYQAPPEYSTRPNYAPAPSGEIRHAQIEFSETFSRTWAAFTAQLGICILVGFLCWIMNMVAGYAAEFIGTSIGLAAGDKMLGVIASIPFRLAAQLFSLWLAIGQAIFFLKIARGQNAPISDIFSGGPYLLRIVGAVVLLMLGFAAILAVCCLPGGVVAAIGALTKANELAALGTAIMGIGSLAAFVGFIVVMLMLFQFYYLVIDRDMGVFEAFSLSRDIMVGNKGTAFGVLAVSVILCCLVVFSTCGLGFFVVIPYMGILYAVLYLSCTGQPTMSDMQYSEQTAYSESYNSL